MKLKVKLINWTAGIPGAMLHPETAKEIGVNTFGRISVKTFKKYPKEIITIVDTAGGIVKKNEVVLSSETREKLGIKKSQKVDVNIARPPKSVSFVKKKMENKKLTKKEIFLIIKDIVDNTLSEPEIALFISAMYEHGMNFKETIYLIKAILNSGHKLNLKNKNIADKHSIGGVPGNRTTPIVVSICASADLIIPKTSSKAITSAAGTADVIETIAEVEFSMPELKKIIHKTNAFMVWGGAIEMVPADSKIIKIEKSLKIDPMSQLLASIMSKKLAVGSKYILIDIPYGKGAKVSKKQAEELKKKFLKIGKYFRKKMRVVLTKGDEPIGCGVGPALELIDVINILNPEKNGPKDLEKKSVFLAGQLLELAGRAKKNHGEKLAREILYSGKAFRKFKEIIKAQKGEVKEIKLPKYKQIIKAKRNCKVKEISNSEINSLARVAGCPTDKYAGLYLHVMKNDKLKKSEKIITIYAESKPRLSEAVRYYEKNHPIKFR